MKILVVRECGGWGDVLCTLFAVRGLRRRYPEAQITYLCMEPFVPLLRLASDLDRVIPFGRTDGEPPRRAPRLRRRAMGGPIPLRAYGMTRRYDRVIDFWCPADRHERVTGGAVTRSRIEAFCDAAGVDCPPAATFDGAPALAVPPQELAWAERTWSTWSAGPSGALPAAREARRVLIQAHSARVTKNWPVAQASELGRLLRARGFTVLAVRTTGADLPGVPTVTGTSHAQAAALTAQCDVVVAPDSGLFHLAATMGRPCVAIFGPTDPRQYLRHYPLARFLWRPSVGRRVGCRCPCLYFAQNGFPPASGACREEGECMAAVGPEEALAAVLGSACAPLSGSACAPLSGSACAPLSARPSLRAPLGVRRRWRRAVWHSTGAAGRAMT
ncbi:MAG TPA: glycosyltransferase family 9 protein [Vicinamibacterales bacterium]|nr:glycosyltransferase family 9 protein [Vicinamibacterales bacterium]